MARNFSYNTYLETFASKIFQNQVLCKYLYYDQDDPQSQATISDTTILYTNQENQRIVFEPHVLNVDDNRFTRLSIMLNDVDIDSVDFYRNIEIVCLLVCHNDLWKLVPTSYVASRPLLILDELESMYNQELISGVGKEKTNSIQLIYFNNNFTGYKVSYKGLNLPID
jgi:hypothetical protein